MRGARLQDCERVSVKRNERALALCTQRECNVRVRVRALARMRARECKTHYAHALRALVSLTSESALISQTRGFCERIRVQAHNT